MRLGSTALATGRVERKLAAILAADVAGYSRLMGADEEGMHERLKTHLRQLVDPKIKEHRGRIVKNTGDGMLVAGTLPSWLRRWRWVGVGEIPDSHRWDSAPKIRFAPDSTLEGTGFEPSVPLWEMTDVGTPGSTAPG
jgi:class 3 adenylate cyclase